MVEMMGFNDYDEGYRYGDLALKLLDSLQCPELTSRTYSCVHGFLKCYKEPLRDALKPLDDAYRLNIITGDVEVRLVLLSNNERTKIVVLMCLPFQFQNAAVGHVQVYVLRPFVPSW
jgi:hypothetical protein